MSFLHVARQLARSLYEGSHMDQMLTKTTWRKHLILCRCCYNVDTLLWHGTSPLHHLVWSLHDLHSLGHPAPVV